MITWKKNRQMLHLLLRFMEETELLALQATNLYHTQSSNYWTALHGGNWVVSATCNKLVSHSKQQLLNCPSFVTAMVSYMVPSPSSTSFLYTGGKWTVTCRCFPHWGTEYAEIKVPSVENPEPINVLPLKPGAGQNKSCMLCPLDELLPCPNFYLPGPFTVIFSKSSPYCLTVLVLASMVSQLGPKGSNGLHCSSSSWGDPVQLTGH